MNKILSIKHIMGFIVFAIFVLGFTTPSFALICKSGKVQCCPGGVQSCCDPIPCTSFPCQEYDISCWGGLDPISDDPIVGPISDDPIVPLCTTGQKKYTASGCSYTTETCCDRGEWCSGTCKTCSSTSESRSCSGNVTNATGGTQTRSRSVTSRCGSCSYGSWGSWTGTCTCASGYTWSGTACISQGCTLTCSGNYFLDKGNCRCCRKTCLWGGMCDCTSGSYLLATTCCDIRISGTVRSIQVCCGYQSCNEMATALGGTVTGSPYVCSKDL